MLVYQRVRHPSKKRIIQCGCSWIFTDLAEVRDHSPTWNFQVMWRGSSPHVVHQRWWCRGKVVRAPTRLHSSTSHLLCGTTCVCVPQISDIHLRRSKNRSKVLEIPPFWWIFQNGKIHDKQKSDPVVQESSPNIPCRFPDQIPSWIPFSTSRCWHFPHQFP
jgi:hypothetical protein